MSKQRSPRVGSLGTKLLIAFLGIALASTLVMSSLTVLVARSELSGIASERYQNDATAIASALASVYKSDGEFNSTNLIRPAALAAQSHAALVVTDPQGKILAAPSDELTLLAARSYGVEILSTPDGPTYSRPIVADGSTVAYATLRFPADPNLEPEVRIRNELAHITLLAALASFAVAFIVGLIFSIRITRPVSALTDAAREMTFGNKEVRVAPHAHGIGELSTLAAAFDKMADALEQEDTLRKNLVVDLAHELRTPLAILQGQTEALLDGIIEPDEEALTSLHDEALRLKRLVGDLETLAAAEATVLHLDTQDVDLVEVARAAVDAMQLTALDAEVSLEMHSSSAIVVDGDAGRLHQVVLNLVSNAVKYTPAGGKIEVFCSSVKSRSGRNARLTVDDSGPGVPKQEREHIFERFYRGTHADQATGSGVGLAVVARLVAAHGGSVKVGDSPLGGARFVVELPLD